MDALFFRRMIMKAGSTPTPPGPYSPDDYVQSGLISLFDGEWNNGYNDHSDSPSVWKDLVGTNDLTITDGVVVGSNYLQNTDYTKSIASKSGVISALTIEFVFQLDDVDTSATTFILANRINTGRYTGNFHLNYGNLGYLYFESLARVTNRRGVPFATTDRAIHTISSAWANTSSAPSFGYDNGTNTMVSNLAGNGRNGAGTRLVIGGLYPEGSVYGMKGKFYCVRFYNRVLTEEEVLQNQRVDANRFTIQLNNS